MFGVGPATRIYLAAGATDMRKGFEGLYGIVRDRLQLEPLSGHIFIFSNAARNRMKLLFWDGSGLWVCAKRLERGRFRWPEAETGQDKVVLSQEEVALLVGGIDLAAANAGRGFGKWSANWKGNLRPSRHARQRCCRRGW
jgi:transposase